MVASDSVFAGSVPALYQRLMVPMLFEPYALDMAHRVGEGRPGDVLETAAGTGVVTRRIATVMSPDARLVATDLNPAMLEIARQTLPDDARIGWRQADAQALPFADGSFDVVVCQFGVMFFPDKALGFREARRVLRPGGQYLFNVWDGLEGNAFARLVAETVAGLFPDDPPLFFERTPHGYHDLTQIAALLGDAGFNDIRTEAIERESKAPSAGDVALAYCQGTPMRGEIETRGGNLEDVTAAVAAAVEARFGTGPVAGPIRAFVISARA